MAYYESGVTPHGLPRDPFKGCVTPRPIGWISTRSASDKDNLAPYSQFNNLTFDPPYVMLSANQTDLNVRKDTTINAEVTGSFAWNICTRDLRNVMNTTSSQEAYGDDEFAKANLAKALSKKVKHPIPMVEASPIKYECTYHTTLRLLGNPPMGTVDVVIGKVVAVHIADKVLTDGMIDLSKVLPVARCGYHNYAVVRETCEMLPPAGLKGYGLEGNADSNAEFAEATREGSR